MDIYVRCFVIAVVCVISLSFSDRWSAITVTHRSVAPATATVLSAPTAIAAAGAAVAR